MKTIRQNFVLKSVVAFLLACSVTACNNSENKGKADTDVSSSQQLVFDKLLGIWQIANGKSFERWTKKDNGDYQSAAFSIKDRDTSWNEQANIYPENDHWVFENTVKGQNDGKPVKFISSFLNENSVQFSNPTHDFPTDVNYTVIDANTVKAFIVGPNNKGGKDTIPFNYTRVK